MSNIEKKSFRVAFMHWLCRTFIRPTASRYVDTQASSSWWTFPAVCRSSVHPDCVLTAFQRIAWVSLLLRHAVRKPGRRAAPEDLPGWLIWGQVGTL